MQNFDFELLYFTVIYIWNKKIVKLIKNFKIFLKLCRTFKLFELYCTNANIVYAHLAGSLKTPVLDRL